MGLLATTELSDTKHLLRRQKPDWEHSRGYDPPPKRWSASQVQYVTHQIRQSQQLRGGYLASKPFGRVGKKLEQGVFW